jgi:hypothetical protein
METVYDDLGDFEKRLKDSRPVGQQEEDSSDEEEAKPMTALDRANEKVRIMVEKLFKAEKTNRELTE